MKRGFLILIVSFVFVQCTVYAKSGKNLRSEIEKIISTKKADIGISVIGPDNDMIDINGDKLYPMLSTFKFPVALTILNRIERKELSMNREIFIKKEELQENTWSPFKEKYPEGNISVTLEEAMKWMMSYSDNNLTDILLRLIGGPKSAEQFLGNKNLVLKNNEEDMHKDWNSQFINKITPDEATRLLKNFNEEKILNSENTKWLYETMINNTTGVKRLKGNLPQNIKVAHRTGTSFTNDKGMTGAINDFGIIELPNRKKIYIAVFVHDSYESFENSEKIIADIAKVTYDYYNKK